MRHSSRREAGAKHTGRGAALLLLVSLGALFSYSAAAQLPATCAVSGQVLNGLSQPIVGTQVTFRVIQPVLATTGAGIAAQDLTTTTDASGNWSLTLIQGLNAQVAIPALGISKDTVIPTGASCPAVFSSLTLYTRGTLTPATILSTTGPSMGGDLTGSSPNPSVIALRGQPLAAGNCANGQARVYNSGTSSYTCQAVTAGAVVTQVVAGTGISVTGSASTPTVNVTLVPVGSGGTGANTLTGPLHGNGVSAVTGSAIALATDVSGTLPLGSGGTGQTNAAAAFNALAPTTTMGDTIYAAGAGSNTRLAGNTTSNDQFLRSLGVAGVAQAPTWAALTAADIPTIPFSGVSGTVPIAQGGTGQTTAGAGYNALSPTTTLGDIAYANGAGTNTRLAGNTTATKNFLTSTGNGSLAAAPAWGAIVAGDVPNLDASKITTGTFSAGLIPALTLTGDATGTTAANTVTKLQGQAWKNAAPANGNVPTWVSANSDWEFQAPTGLVTSASGSGGTTGLTLTGGPTGAVTLTLGGTLNVANGGTGQTTAPTAFNALSPLTTLGDVLYGGASGAGTRLGGNTAATRQFLTSQGTGAAAQAPTFSLLAAGDIPNIAASQVTSAWPTGFLIGAAGALTSQAIPVTVAQGGTGATTLTGILSGNGTGAITGGTSVSLTTQVSGVLPVANGGTNGLLPIANGGTAATTANGAFNALAPLTTLGDLVYEDATPKAVRLAGNTTAAQQFLTQTGNGTISAAPSWAALASGNIPSLDFAKITTGIVPVAQGGTGQSAANAGFNALAPMTTVGDVLYEDATPKAVRLAGNTTATKQFFTSTGTGAVAQAPAWGTLAAGDIPALGAAAITSGTFSTALFPAIAGDVTGAYTGVTVAKLQNRNVAATAPTDTQCLKWVTANSDWEPGACAGAGGGSVTSVNASGGTTGFSFTGGPITGSGVLTLTGTLGIANGGTGGTSAATGFNGLSPMTTLGDVIYGGAAGAGTRLAGNTTTTPMYLKSTGSAGLATAPAFQQISAATDLSGLLPVANGGTGVGTLTGYVKGNGTSAFTAQAVPIPVSDGGTGATTLAAGYLHGNGTGAITSSALAASLTTDVTGILPLANGGTGTGTVFTQGSVIYAGASGIHSQDNAGLFFNDSTNSLGIQTATPAVALAVGAGTAQTTAKISGGSGADQAPVLSMFRTGNVEWVLAGRGAGNSDLSIAANPANYADASLTSAAKITFTTSGNVGIGTTAPSSPLTVSATGASVPGALFTGPTGAFDGVDIAGPTGTSHAYGLKVSTASTASSSEIGAILAQLGGSTATCGAVGMPAAVCASSSTTSSIAAIAGAVVANTPTVIVRGISGQTSDLVSARSFSGGASGMDQNGSVYLQALSSTASARATFGSATENITLSTLGTTTDSTGFLLPANSVIKAITVYINQSITVASAFTVGDATTAGRFLAAGTGLSIGSTGVGLVHVDQTGAAGPRQTSAAKIRITTTGTPSAGIVAVTVFFETFTPPSAAL